MKILIFLKNQEIHFHLEISKWIHANRELSMTECRSWFCSTSSRRKPGWRFTTGSTYWTAINWPSQAPANIREFCHRVCVSEKLLYYGYWFCSINFEYIILKFNFVWLSASVLDRTFINNWGDSSLKCWKNYEILKKYRNLNFSKQNLSLRGVLKFQIFENSFFSENITVFNCVKN